MISLFQLPFLQQFFHFPGSPGFGVIDYRLLPYLYTTFWQYSTNGTPFLRPLAFVDASDSDTLYRNEEFMAGDHLLVCPVSEPSVSTRYLYLPRGNWYGYFDYQLYRGGREISFETPLDIMPIFVRAGAVIPHYPVMQNTGEKKLESLLLMVYYGTDKTRSTYYEDSGDGYEYKKGECNVKTFGLSAGESSLLLRQHESGKYAPDYETYTLCFVGLPFEPLRVVIDEELSQRKLIQDKNGNWLLEVPREFEELKISAGDK